MLARMLFPALTHARPTGCQNHGTISCTSMVRSTAAVFRMAATPADDWRAEVPNAMTMLRVLTIPVLAATFFSHAPFARRLPAAIFALCAATDWLDGYLSRQWGVQSDLGAFLDPVADKLLVCACLVLLTGAMGAVVALPTAVIVSREIGVSALREWMGSRGQRDTVAVGQWGKVKTAAQMAALQLLLISAPQHSCLSSATSGAASALLARSGLGLLYVAAILTCTSAIGYVQAAWPLLTQKEGKVAAPNEPFTQ